MDEKKETGVYEMTFSKPDVVKDTGGKTFVETHRNDDMESMIVSVEPYLESATGKFGYAIARNLRKIREACAEYLQARQDLITELGEEEQDESGNKTGVIRLRIGTEAYKEYLRRIGEYSGIRHNVEIYKINYSVLPNSMTAGDMLRLEWMLIDETDQAENVITPL